jgi:hypothetical protein
MNLRELAHAFSSDRYFHIGLVRLAFTIRESYAYEVGSSYESSFYV